MISRAMLMAAGLGTRMRPFTDRAPKALIPVMGVPVAQFALDALVTAGVGKVVANVHHLAPQARAGLEALGRGGAELVISDESERLLGSAGGIRKALPQFDGEAFFYVNADVISDLDLRSLARTHERLRRERGVLMTLSLKRNESAKDHYREIYFDPSSGLVTGFSADALAGRPFFSSSAVIEPEALRGVPEGVPAEFVPLILEPLVRERRVGFHFSEGLWKDVGSPALWLETHLDLMRRLETGCLSPLLRTRLESVNRRVANEIWMSRSANGRRRVSWQAPCYYSGGAPVENLGPLAVLYGDSLAGELSSGIGFSSSWISVRSS